jgi:Flp pilus assembly pilin Flp
MKKLTHILKSIWKDESGQGAVEYILLLVVVVAIGLLFKRQITDLVSGKLGELSGAIGQFSPQ